MTPRGRGAGAVTLKDVAAAAGVSVATASQALSGRGRMTPATRERVRGAAEDLGYLANALAQGLRTGRTRALGVHHERAAANLRTPYFRDFLAGAVEAAHRHDHDLVVLSSDTSRPRTTAPRVDGVVVVDPIADDLRARELMALPVPVVAGEHVPSSMPPCAVVAADHATAVRAVLDAAARQGVRHPMLVAPDENSGWGEVLRDVVGAWSAERGLTPVLVASRFGELSVDRHEELLAPVLADRPEVDLVLAASPFAAQAAMAVLRGMGRQPGRDVLVAACADEPALLAEDPPVTAVELPAYALGVACVERLVAILEDDRGPAAALGTVQTVPAPVHLRASTAGALTRAMA
ncbi:LacI family DNA-binding transcriptional regulator [Cellulomonas chengniuliangii]|uniref:LacI family transcriptional regulator n=1 Tax=Cellulomonas chengniuliangii TaxID=2968084 RepID=A0ABY5KXW4_9CELL|nr:LacI family DNA-binding transcriptional regulator [Cellulomonas chengniuliangii]MCC2309440.1 LacI family transcriptional regulator [Cellulomonas chengniuliangii]MCC2316711.1 LacI family transcriptional regulator [Cellulomonas chengniuliangii]UUI74999.1 LacI family transcriptional regulator [Cellulomonas chengniuliangii]